MQEDQTALIVSLARRRFLGRRRRAQPSRSRQAQRRRCLASTRHSRNCEAKLDRKNLREQSFWFWRWSVLSDTATAQVTGSGLVTAKSIMDFEGMNEGPSRIAGRVWVVVIVQGLVTTLNPSISTTSTPALWSMIRSSMPLSPHAWRPVNPQMQLFDALTFGGVPPYGICLPPTRIP